MIIYVRFGSIENSTIRPQPAINERSRMCNNLFRNFKMFRCDPFDAISSAVDLDDPAQWGNAQCFMVDALERVIASLPGSAQVAVSVAKRYLACRATVGSVATERVKLWGEIEGRDQADEPDVLRIRATICALHGIDEQAPLDRLAYFLMLWERSSLSMVELAESIWATYGVIYKADS